MIDTYTYMYMGMSLNLLCVFHGCM